MSLLKITEYVKQKRSKEFRSRGARLEDKIESKKLI